MFTGIVEEMGRVVERRGARLVVAAAKALDGTEGGGSISVNGVCLTVVERGSNRLGFDLGPETLAVSALGDLAVGDAENLERPLRMGDFLGGHLVQGHVDATGEILTLEPHGQDHRFEVSLPPEIHRLCIDKGSLCVDGISLTIAELKQASAVFWITPHTFAHTHLHASRVGQRINLEADLWAKYVERLVK